ncbi:hypothetical protein ABLAC_11750 [Acinetobacter baumannii LAC-4]|nr:hypothetical protein ABLAC_11750 [Acinetobacter baumannii LAC-4]
MGIFSYYSYAPLHYLIMVVATVQVKQLFGDQPSHKLIIH